MSNPQLEGLGSRFWANERLVRVSSLGQQGHYEVPLVRRISPSYRRDTGGLTGE